MGRNAGSADVNGSTALTGRLVGFAERVCGRQWDGRIDREAAAYLTFAVASVVGLVAVLLP
jgi:hypothetical protein